MIYDQINGFRDDLSKLEYIKSNGLLKGNGLAYYIDGYDTTKFRMSNFVEKLETDEGFRNHFNSTAEQLMLASIKETRNIVVEPAIEEAGESLDE